MKTTRRQFIKSLIATAATAAIAPQVLVESAHGASDLTARERDAVANALGLGQKQWAGWDDGLDSTEHLLDQFIQAVARQNVHAGTGLHPGEQTVLIKTNAPPEHVNCRCIRRVQVPMLLPGESLFRAIEFDVSDQEPLTEARVQKTFINLCEQQKIAERFPFATRHLRDLQNEYDNEPKIL